MEINEIDWDDAVGRLGPPLFSYFRASFPKSIADDLVQETLIRLVRKTRSHEYQSQLGTLKSYAYGIAHFVRLEALRASSKIQYLPDFWDRDLETPESESPDQIVLVRQLRKAISKLPETQCQIVLLTLDRDLTLPEIAQILSIPLNTIKSHIHRAKAQLKLLLNEGENHERPGTRSDTLTPPS